MASDSTDHLDKVFKALGNLTRRRILQLLAQRPRYPYELSKILGLTGRAILKHLMILQEAGLVEREQRSSDIGPDRSYYRLNVSFGLSTTILPNVFVVRKTEVRQSRRLTVPPGFRIPEAQPDVRAVKVLLKELGKVNKKLQEIDEERVQYANLRGQIIQKIESIMEQCNWDRETCQRIRMIINPVSHESGDFMGSDIIAEVVDIFSKLMAETPKRKTRTRASKNRSDSEIEIEFE